MRKFEVLAKTHMRYVGAAAHINVLVVVINAYVFGIARNVFIQNSQLIRLIAFLKDLVSLIPSTVILDHLIVGLSQIMHLFIQSIEILCRKLMIGVDVIIKTVVNHRTYGHLGIGPKLF